MYGNKEETNNKSFKDLRELKYVNLKIFFHEWNKVSISSFLIEFKTLKKIEKIPRHENCVHFKKELHFFKYFIYL